MSSGGDSDEPELELLDSVPPEHRALVYLALLLRGQRRVVPVARDAVLAQIDRDRARQRLWDALALWVQPSEWAGLLRELPWQARLVLVVLLGIVALQLVGVEVELGALADAASHAYTGQPHRCEVMP